MSHSLKIRLKISLKMLIRRKLNLCIGWSASNYLSLTKYLLLAWVTEKFIFGELGLAKMRRKIKFCHS